MCVIYTYMHHQTHICAWMHHVHIHAPHAPQKTCVHRYTNMHHMHTCASPIKGAYIYVHMSIIYTHMHHQTHMVSSQKVGDQNWEFWRKKLKSLQTWQTNITLSMQLCQQKYLSRINFSSLYFQILQRQVHSITFLLKFNFFIK